MKKRAQITIFIIIGIIIVMVASFVFFIARNISSIDTKQSLSTETTDAQLIKGFVQDCVDNVAEQSIVVAGSQGGHIYPPSQKIDLQDSFIAYDYYEGQNLLPTKEQIEEDLSEYVSESIVKCVDESKSKFSSELELSEIKTTAVMTDKYVSFDISYPIIIKYFEKTEKLDGNFKAKVDVRLAYMLNTANSIIAQEISNPDWFNLSHISQIDLKAEIFPHGENEYIYLLTDTKAKINNRNYTFVFANKFKENLPPTIVPISQKEAKVGKEIVFYIYATDPEGDAITYSGIDSKILDEKTGAVRFMSSIAGTYNFQIKATDTHGNYDEKLLSIKVIQ